MAARQVTLRPPMPDEARAVAQLITASRPDPYPEVRVRAEWTSPGVDLDRDVRVAVTPQARVVGYGVVEDVEGRHDRFWVGLHGPAAGELLAWAEERVRGSAGGAARILSGAWSFDDAVRSALERQGFALVRHSYRMGIDLAEAEHAVDWPAGIRVRAFRAGDERRVYEAHMETFEDSWEHVHRSYDEWRHWFVEREDFDASLWFLAEEDGRLAGIVLCRRDDADPSTGWVTILGVRRPWRRRGLGRALLLHGFSELRRRGAARAVLGVDAESLTGAHRLYERAGMRVVERYEIYEKEL